jgi:hypothetical protein
MDDIDMMQEREEHAAPARLAHFRMPIGPEPTGRCLQCDDPSPVRRWCSSECHIDYFKQQRADAQRPHQKWQPKP